MGSKVVIYHNPRCSKSRQTLALLQEQGVEPEVVEYLKAPPSASKVKALLKQLGGEPSALLRKKEAPYKELGLSKDSSAKAVAEAIAEHPVLMERPLVVANGKAALGRPPENVLEIL